MLGPFSQDETTSMDIAARIYAEQDETGTECIPVLEEILSSAHEQMPRNSADIEASMKLRRIYTDASILLAFLILGQDGAEANACEAIAALDKAIIIAGPYNGGQINREDLIDEIIRKAQLNYLPLPEQSSNSGGSSNLVSLDQTLPTAAKPIPVLKDFPSMATFQRKLSGQAFALRTFASDWPAVNFWSSRDYLLRATGRGRLVPVEVGADYRSDEWSQELLPWDDFLDHLFLPQSEAESSREKQHVLYLAQHNLFQQFPALRNDITVPDYVYTSLSPPASFAAYRPPRNEDGVVINCWFGKEGVRSPAHTDPFFNFYVQVTGQKQIWLAPPDTPGMRPFDARPPTNPAENKVEPGMSNTSQVDVFADLKEQPAKFLEHVPTKAQSIVLGPGDALFFPPGWWHAMRPVGPEPSMSVSFWF